tara:strand:- start:3137 stop:3409 length:273 start_codon:yes stop_codon:yes gene_type:complete
METKLTQEERLAVIARLVKNVNSIEVTESVQDFVADVKSDEMFQEHGLLNAQKEDLEDEASLIDHTPYAESIDEEDEGMGLSEEMRGVYS